jgi:hypothetical protein
MSTAAQITANRANAQLSTGPRSVEGKAASSRNAWKLGIHAETLIIPGEDAAALEQATADFHRQFRPSSELESELVQTLIRSTWLQRRLTRIETEVLNARLAALEPTEFPLGQIFIQDSEGPRTLDKISRRQQSLQRDFFRALAELRRIRECRMDAEIMALAGPPPELNRVRFDNPPQPAPRTDRPAPVEALRDRRAPRDPQENLALRL